MSTYNFSLHNYNAIEDASIVIDGITVLTGVNGCGKSTLSKWLYYMVDSISNYEEIIFDMFISALDTNLSSLYKAQRDIRLTLRRENIFNDSSSNSLLSIRGELQSLKYSDESIVKAQIMYNSAINSFSKMFELFLQKETSKIRIDRLLASLGIDNKGVDVEDLVNRFQSTYERFAEKEIKKFMSFKEKRPQSIIFNYIKENYKEDTHPENIQISEDSVNILNKDSVNTIYSLNNAIYIDTPLSISEKYSNNPFWNKLQNLMLHSVANVNKSYSTTNILNKILELLNGDIKLVNSKMSWIEDELHYVREDGLDIPIEKTATGFKTLEYFQRLIENRHLTKDTLLLIDEPEVHLHPQWIVEFAHLLVLLNKYIGTKIIIASHNPDMISAIRYISEKEDVLGSVNFYLAEQSAKNRFMFYYKNIGKDIEPIFASFNIALDRIQQYGKFDD